MKIHIYRVRSSVIAAYEHYIKELTIELYRGRFEEKCLKAFFVLKTIMFKVYHSGRFFCKAILICCTIVYTYIRTSGSIYIVTKL